MGSHWRWAWLLLGFAIFLWSLTTGGGLLGPILSWELEKYQFVDAATAIIALIIVLILPPLIALVRFQVRHPSMPSRKLAFQSLIAGGLLLAMAGASWWHTRSLPNLSSRPTRIEIEDLKPSTPVPECTAILAGIPQQRFELRYREGIGTGVYRSFKLAHRVTPMTGEGWTPGQPVRFLINSTGTYPNQPHSVKSGPTAETGRGILLQSVPGYLRAAFARKGLILANDAMMHSTDPDTASLSWDVFAAFTGFLGFFALVLGAGLTMRDRTGYTYEPRRTVSLLRRAILAFGGLFLLVGLVLCARKTVHILNLTHSPGVITGVQHHQHSLGRYSFYVKFPAGGKVVQAYSSADSLLYREEGTKITVLYDAGSLDQPEVLVLDVEWFLCGVPFLIGAMVIAFGLWFGHSRP